MLHIQLYSVNFLSFLICERVPVSTIIKEEKNQIRNTLPGRRVKSKRLKIISTIRIEAFGNCSRFNFIY